MREAPDVVAVTGATGHLGGRVAAALAAAGVRQRLVVRDPSRAPELPGADVATATYADAEAMRAALIGVRSLVLVSGSEAVDRVAQHRTAVDAAVAAGVERIVYTSFVGAGPACTFTFGRDHWFTEEHIRGSGLRFTFLRDNLYLDIFPLLVGKDGVIRGPAGEGRVAAVARDDAADAAVAVVLDESGRHDGRTFDLTGPRSITMFEVAATLSSIVGRDISYYAESLEEAYASRMPSGHPRWEVDGWVTSYAAIAAGELEQVSDAVPSLTGHPATSFEEFLTTHPEAWAHLLTTSR